jgi:hypothetical protein
MIAVRSRDLRTPDDYREIARALEAGGRPDEALDWARRGLEAHADRTWETSPLRELTAELLRYRGDRGDRRDRPGAFELFRTATSWRAPTPAAALVEILSHEGEIDAAWEGATDHGCDDRMWRTLARARDGTAPPRGTSSAPVIIRLSVHLASGQMTTRLPSM